MVDIPGRDSLLEEAHQFIDSMSTAPNDVVWRTLLASSRAHRNVEMAEKSLEHITRLEPDQ